MKAIPKFDGYYADTKGNIFSLRPEGGSHTWRTIPKLIKQQIHPNGYLGLNIMKDGKRTRQLAHLLILTTYKGERPSKKHQACHGIKGKLDNSIDNIYWDTWERNNIDDKKRDGTFKVGDTHGMSKLTSEKVKKIKALFKEGADNHSIADMFKVHHSTISKIRQHHTWVHIVI